MRHSKGSKYAVFQHLADLGLRLSVRPYLHIMYASQQESVVIGL